jgi:phage tail sheath protein FI
MLQYETLFGGPFAEDFSVEIAIDSEGQTTLVNPITAPTDFIYQMYYSMQLYFDNGGGPCYIISVGAYGETPAISASRLENGLEQVLVKEDEPTLIVFPDASALDDEVEFYDLFKKALAQCEELKDRFTLVDVFNGQDDFTTGTDIINDGTVGLRTLIGTGSLSYGAAYYPYLETSLGYHYDPENLVIDGTNNGVDFPSNLVLRLPEGQIIANPSNADISLYHLNNAAYRLVVSQIEKHRVVLPPSSVMAGIYAKVDSTRGVWKAPANVSLVRVEKATVALNDEDQAGLNVHPTGKSVNAIRFFSGKGLLVWGARTLDGNDNEWRYVPVRRFFNFVEESVKKASEPFVFEPNDANTWIKVRGMIENFLLLHWRAGALAGAKPEDAFYVKVGLPDTMTADDILNGRMIVEIGMAVVRPAEFIILTFSHKMQAS